MKAFYWHWHNFFFLPSLIEHAEFPLSDFTGVSSHFVKCNVVAGGTSSCPLDQNNFSNHFRSIIIKCECASLHFPLADCGIWNILHFLYISWSKGHLVLTHCMNCYLVRGNCWQQMHIHFHVLAYYSHYCCFWSLSRIESWKWSWLK